MIETKVAEIDGKSVVYKQCVNEEEQKQVPSGLSGYWEYDGKKIYAPGEVVRLVTQSAASKKLNAVALTDPKVIQNHYQQLRKVQQENVNTYYSKMIADYKSNPNIPDAIKNQAIKQLEQTQKMFTQPDMYPDINGVFKPNRQQAETLLGKSILDQIPEDQQKEMFGE